MPYFPCKCWKILEKRLKFLHIDCILVIPGNLSFLMAQVITFKYELKILF